MSDRQKIIIAICASVLLHCLFLLVVVAWAVFFSSAQAEKPVELPPKQIELTLVPPESTPTPPPIAKAPAALIPIDSNGLHESEKPPEKPLYDSDKNMQAASEHPSNGLIPMPSQDGQDLPFVGFKTKQVIQGKPEETPASVPAPSAPARPKPATPDYPVTNVNTSQKKPIPVKQPRVEATPEPTATPTPEEIPRPTPVATPMPTPEELPRPTPVLAAETPPDALTFRTASPKPSAVGQTPKPTPTPTATPPIEKSPTPEVEPPRPTPIVEPSAPPPMDLAMMTTPTPSDAQRKPTPAPGYQPNSEQTHIEGSISNRGKAAVNSISTPAGRYRKAIGDKIGSRWSYYVERGKRELNSGEVKIRFFIDSEGRVKNAGVVSNSSNQGLADISLSAIYDSELPPLPAELEPYLNDGLYEIDFSFFIY